jgi:hypothetical protein
MCELVSRGDPVTDGDINHWTTWQARKEFISYDGLLGIGDTYYDKKINTLYTIIGYFPGGGGIITSRREHVGPAPTTYIDKLTDDLVWHIATTHI